MSKAQYDAFLSNLEQQQQNWSKKVSHLSSGEGGHGSVELIFDLKLELNEMKQKLDSVVTDLSMVKAQV